MLDFQIQFRPTPTLFEGAAGGIPPVESIIQLESGVPTDGITLETGSGKILTE